MSAHVRAVADRTRVRLIILAAVSVVALALGVLTAPNARAAVMFGNDVSWPQCDALAGRAGPPMPPADTEFVVIGLTNGLPFTENPCVAGQVTWARDRSKPAQAYTMAGFPTSAQLTTYRSQGPWSSSTRAGQLSNVGYSEARAVVVTLQRIGWHPPVVWIDVEPRSSQPWPSSTTAQRLDNRYVIEGLMRGLRDWGYPYGVYSNASGWSSITGSWRLPGVPVWATSGTLDYANEALDKCTQASFSGGRVYLSQWWDSTRDYDRTCDPYAFGAIATPPSSLSGSTGDFNGDWKNDVLARWNTGALKLYAGNGSGSLSLGTTIGSNWSAYNALETVGDFSGDGALDVVVRQASTGYLWLWRGNGKGGFIAPAIRIGTGWNAMNAIVGVGDFDGDQKADLIARRASDGGLYLYAGNGSGGWKSVVRIASGWNKYDTVVGVGDVNGDGRPDLMSRERSTARLWLHLGNGTGGISSSTVVGAGWNQFTAIMSPGDFTGDRVGDLLARDTSGNLWLYPRTLTGWGTRTRVSTGWNVANAIF